MVMYTGFDPVVPINRSLTHLRHTHTTPCRTGSPDVLHHMLHVDPSPFQLKHRTPLGPYAHGTAPLNLLVVAPYLIQVTSCKDRSGSAGRVTECHVYTFEWMPRSTVQVLHTTITAQPSHDYYGIPFPLVLSSVVAALECRCNFLLVAILFMLTSFIYQLLPCYHQQYPISCLPPLLQEDHSQNHQYWLPVCFANEYFQAKRLTKGQKDGSESQVVVSHQPSLRARLLLGRLVFRRSPLCFVAF